MGDFPMTVHDSQGEGRQLGKDWRCPFCDHEWNFAPNDLEYASFMVVHHLVDKHRISKGGILAYDARLREALEEYLETSSRPV
jgi:hypothetical protein